MRPYWRRKRTALRFQVIVMKYGGNWKSGGPALVLISTVLGMLVSIRSSARAQTKVLLRAFTRRSEYPNGSLIRDSQGNLYGTTSGGGLNNCADATSCGTVWSLTPNSEGTWTEAVLYNFHGPDGATPLGGLIRDAQGNLYGTTIGGGNLFCDFTHDGCGIVFRVEVTPNGTETVLQTFTGGAD